MSIKGTGQSSAPGRALYFAPSPNREKNKTEAQKNLLAGGLTAQNKYSNLDGRTPNKQRTPKCVSG